MSHPRRPTLIASTIAAVAALLLAGCASQLSDRDRDALATLAHVAATTSTVDPDLVNWTECWVPSDHLLSVADAGNDTTWRVLCRVHWTQPDGMERFQDTTCVGDFALDPMLENCYRWTYYDQMPVYEDHPGVRAE